MESNGQLTAIWEGRNSQPGIRPSGTAVILARITAISDGQDFDASRWLRPSEMAVRLVRSPGFLRRPGLSIRVTARSASLNTESRAPQPAVFLSPSHGCARRPQEVLGPCLRSCVEGCVPFHGRQPSALSGSVHGHQPLDDPQRSRPCSVLFLDGLLDHVRGLGAGSRRCAAFRAAHGIWKRHRSS